LKSSCNRMVTLPSSSLSDVEGEPNVVDNRGSTSDFVGTRVGEQLHYGWVHPYISCARNYCRVDTSNSGEIKHRVDEGVLDW
jgi:hypothetical protein